MQDPLIQHTVIKWASVAAAAVSALSVVGGAWWYLHEQQLLNERWYEDDQTSDVKVFNSFESIKDRQVKITEELATQTLRLADIETLINRQWQQRERRFDALESEHRGIINAISTANDDLNFRLGFHAGVRAGQKIHE